MAWVTAQSLCLLKLRTSVNPRGDGLVLDTDARLRDITDDYHYSISDRALLKSVSERQDFGFTVGASPGVLACLDRSVRLIADTALSTAEKHQHVAELTGQLASFTKCLPLPPSPLIPTSHMIFDLHNHIFALGILIYLQRHTVNPPPHLLVAYTSSLFQAVHAFSQLSAQRSQRSDSNVSVSVTIWPVFIAAVECYRPEDLSLVTASWLNGLEGSGIGNRRDIRRVVEGVWAERAKRLALQKVDEEISLGDVVVDWREVMESMNLDILLV